MIDSLGGPGALKTAGIVGGLSGSCDGHGEDQDEEFEVPEESEEVIGMSFTWCHVMMLYHSVINVIN